MTLLLTGAGLLGFLVWLARIAPASARKPINWNEPPSVFLTPGLDKKRPKCEHMAAFMAEVMRRRRAREQGDVIK